MVLKRVLSLSLLLALAGGAFLASEQNAEAARCCRQRCNRRCCYNGGYASWYGYTNAAYGNCGSCSSGTCNTGTAPANYDGTAPAPAPAAAPAPPPAPAT